MKRRFHQAIWLVLLCCAGPGPGLRIEAQTASTNGAALPPLPVYRPPTEVFRGLLKMKPDELAAILTKQRPELRQRLTAKIQEYNAMTPPAREARLHATELHDYLQFFIVSPAADREQQLASIPAEYQKEAGDRLKQFDSLPPALRQEALAQESTASYFVGASVSAPNRILPVPPPPMPPDPMGPLRALTPEERADLLASFDHFFDLSAAERQGIIQAIPANERIQVGRTLAQIEKLPREQREQSLQVLGTLAAMTDGQRQVFFNSAERWNAMSPAERETWLKVVSHLPAMPPQRPPPPMPVLLPPRSAMAPSGGVLSAATNPGN